MAREWRTRTFKSGNSVAIRLPKAFGVAGGDEVTLVAHDDGTMSIWRTNDSAAMLDRLYGSFSAGFMADGRGDIDQPERDWADRSAAA